jgi:hypothetical protein
MAKKKIIKPTRAEIKKGTRMEEEEHKDVTHGKKSIAKKIALDHLVKEKMPTYYEELPKMEKKLKSKAKKKGK